MACPVCTGVSGSHQPLCKTHQQMLPPEPTGTENGVAYDAFCQECGQRVEHRMGAWICPTHFDRGHVLFVARQEAAA